MNKPPKRNNSFKKIRPGAFSKGKSAGKDATAPTKRDGGKAAPARPADGKSTHRGGYAERKAAQNPQKPAQGRQGDAARHERNAPSSRPGGAKTGGRSGKTAGFKADLFGMHAVREAWANPKRHIHALFITQSALEEFQPHLAVDAKRPTPTIVTKEELDRAFPAGTVHQGIALATQELAELSLSDIIIRAGQAPRSVIAMLDQVTDPHNVGAILRSACAFGVNGVVMQSKHAPDLGGIVAKTACGAVEHIDVAYETNLSRALETLQKNGYTVIGMDEHSTQSFDSLPAYERAVIVLGAEGSGMRRLVKEHCDVLVTLPTRPPIASLNVSNAAAVAFYALCR